MLTLGLFEGVLAATIGFLVLVGAANENAPLHRVFGPVVTLALGGMAYGIHEAGVVKGLGDIVGLAFFAFVAFIGPVVLMRYAWKQMRALERAPARTVEARSESMQPVEYRRAG